MLSLLFALFKGLSGEIKLREQKEKVGLFLKGLLREEKVGSLNKDEEQNLG